MQVRETVQFRRVLLFATLSLMLPAQPGLSPEELRFHSGAYWPPSLTSLNVEARLVEVGVVVRDARGHTVGGLTRGDFEVEESGKFRQITAFSADIRTPPPGAAPAVAAKKTPEGPAAPTSAERPPRFLALVFDDLNMTAADLIPTRIAAKHFLKQGLRPEDLIGVFFVSRGQIEPFTSDTRKLDDALDRLRIANRSFGHTMCPYLSSYEALSIAERLDPAILPAKVLEATNCGYCRPGERDCPDKIEGLARAVWEPARDTSRRTLEQIGEIVGRLAGMPGRGVLVLASAGFLSRTLEQDRELIIDHALHAGVVINSLDAKGLFTQDMGTTDPHISVASAMLRQSMGIRPQLEGNDSLAILAEGTGGLFFHNNNDLALGFRELGLAPEFSYSLGFTPSGAPDNQYHKLKVRLHAKSHNSVQARPGYYAVADPPKPPAPERRIDKELLSAMVLGEVPLSLTASSMTGNGSPALHSVLHLDVQHLPFANLAGVRALKVIFIAALFDSNSAFVAGRETEADFALKEETFGRLTDGLNVGLSLAAPPGKYRLRVVVQEMSGGKVTALNQSVEIRRESAPPR